MTVKKKAVTKKAPQKEAAKPTGKTTEEKPEIEILQTSKCKTVSGKSTLTYNLGKDDEDNIHIRVFGNTGGGYFSKEWLQLDHITSVLGDVTDHPITSIDLIPLFKGRSVNTPGYLLAVLIQEGLLVSVEDKKRKYQFVGADKFTARISKKAK